MNMGIASIITLILTEVPAAVDLINKLKADNRTVPTADEIAALDVDDAALVAAYQRLFPGQNPPA